MHLRCTLCVFLLTIPSFLSKNYDGYDHDILTFSPDGRIRQIEYALNSVAHYGDPLIVLCGKDCLLASSYKICDDGSIPSSYSNIDEICDGVWLAASGYKPDISFLVAKLKLRSIEFKKEYGYSIPARLLIHFCAIEAQRNTQSIEQRPLGVVYFLFHRDERGNGTITRIDPAAQVVDVFGDAVGRGMRNSKDSLREKFECENEERCGLDASTDELLALCWQYFRDSKSKSYPNRNTEENTLKVGNIEVLVWRKLDCAPCFLSKDEVEGIVDRDREVNQ